MHVQGRMLQSHIGNGGLMQVLWLARELQRTAGVETQVEFRKSDGPVIILCSVKFKF